jgi:hypothetical protein
LVDPKNPQAMDLIKLFQEAAQYDPAFLSAKNAYIAGKEAYWQAFAVLFPGAIFRWLEMPEPNYPQFWQCIGMIVGVYGIGYAIAAFDPARHWPIVLVGFLGKVFGPLGMAQALWTGQLPWGFALNCVTNDLVWWVPFFLILKHAWERYQRDSGLEASPDESILLKDSITSNGRSLAEISQEHPVLVVFLRQSGCTFCILLCTKHDYLFRVYHKWSHGRFVALHISDNTGCRAAALRHIRIMFSHGQILNKRIQSLIHPRPLSFIIINDHWIKVVPHFVDNNTNHCPFFRIGISAVFVWTTAIETNHRILHPNCGRMNGDGNRIRVIK